MKSIIYLFFVVRFLCHFFGYSQEPAVSHEIGAVLDPGTTYDYVARDYIKLKPGFQYNPSSGSYTFTGEIQEDMIFPVPTNNPISVQNRELDYSLIVGTTAGTQSVSTTGAALYEIPILIPPGTASMQPSLSLVYNSQVGNGIMGMGWSLAGLSAITRVNKTIFHDEKVEGIDFIDDRFSLDGARLIAINGINYGGDGCQYFTEVFNASRITSYGSAGNGPVYFEVETKDGKLVEYGKTVDSRIEAEGRPDILIWNINRISDRLGNYIEFEYDEESDHTSFRIKEIRYTGNAEVSPELFPYNRIHFYYGERIDKSKTYVAGSVLKQDLLLQKICTYADNDDLFRKYELSYHHEFYSHLIEIKEYNGKETQYNSTVFEWDDESTLCELQDCQYTQNVNYLFGDFTGDGKTDYIIAPITVTPSNNMFTLYKNNGNGVFSNAGSWVISTHYNALKYGFIQYVDGGLISKTGYDLNGDGYHDFIWCEKHEELGQIQYWHICFFYDETTQTFNSTQSPIYTSENYDSRIGDFNGDMVDDFLWYEYDNHVWKIMSFPNDEIFYAYGNENLVWYNRGVAGNFNTDGKLELLVITPSNGCRIYEFINDSLDVIYESQFTNGINSFRYGDFNGDGYTDLLTFINATPSIFLFTGDDFVISELLNNINLPNPGDNNRLYSNDYNGDGMTDILNLRIPGEYKESELIVTLFESTGITFTQTEAAYTILEWTQFDDSEVNHGYFNEDGNIDIKMHHPQYLEKLIYFMPNRQNHLIHQMANGLNAKTEISYLPLTNSSVYTKLTVSDGKLIDFQGPLLVVNEISTDNGTDGRIITSFTYEGARIHREGKGFQGFEKTIRSVDLSQIPGEKQRRIIEYYQLVGTYYYPALTQRIEQILDGQSKYGKSSVLTISELDNSYSFINGYPDDKIFLPYNDVSVNHDFNNEIKTKLEIRQIDTYGNVLNSVKTFYSEDAVTVEGSETISSTYTNEGSWCNHLPRHTTVEQQRGTDPIFSVSYDYLYFLSGLLEKETKFHGKPKQLIHVYTYDGYGNVTSTSISSDGLQTRTETFAYDVPKGRFLIKQTNPLLG